MSANSEDCVPVCFDAFEPLKSEEVYDYLTNASTKYGQKLSTLPPVQPKEGTVFLYYLGSDKSEWDLKKRKLRYCAGCISCCFNFSIILLIVIMLILTFRCDQYRWVHKGTYSIKLKSYEIKKKNSMIDVVDGRKGDERFRRHEYWGLGPYYILHYMGDSSIFKSFRHRNSKISNKPFVTSAPHVKEKVHA